MRVIVLTQAYPSVEKPYNLAYVHTRVLEYQKVCTELRVLSFDCPQRYEYQGVMVSSEKDITLQSYDVLVSHAPNLRNHIRWILQHKAYWKKMVWVIHGHEVLIKQKYYPPAYPWLKKQSLVFSLLDYSYDLFKVRVLAYLIQKWLKQKSLHLIFVSQWMQQAFLECVSIRPDLIKRCSSIVPNSLHPVFRQKKWTLSEPLADFVTIRPLDSSKYAIDVVLKLALRWPNLKFDIYGEGNYFKHNALPANVRHIARFLPQTELPELLNHYRAALLPTRLDAQGVMSCEIASYGMPLLTSDLPICREMLSLFPQVAFFSMETLDIDLPAFLTRSTQRLIEFPDMFSDRDTIHKEIKIILQHAQTGVFQ